MNNWFNWFWRARFQMQIYVIYKTTSLNNPTSYFLKRRMDYFLLTRFSVMPK